MKEHDRTEQTLIHDPSDQVANSTALSPEAAELIGDEGLSYIENADRIFAELDRLDDIKDPFTHDNRGSEVDLSFLKPDMANLVVDYHKTSRPFKGMTGRQIAGFGRKMAMRIGGIHEDVKHRVLDAELSLEEAAEELQRVAEPTPESIRISLLPELQQIMDRIFEARDRSPSKTSLIVVENAYLAAISSRNHATGTLGSRGLKFIPDVMGGVTDALRQKQTTFKEVSRAAAMFRGAGSEIFKILGLTINVEKVKEAAALLDLVDATKQRLPDGTELEGSQLDAAIDAETYLTTTATRAFTILRESDPSVMKDKRFGPIIKRLIEPSAHRSRESETEAEQPIIGDGVLSKLTEAKNIMRGGRRLKPDNGETEDGIKQTADKLYALKDSDDNKLLDPEEAGLIVAIVTGKFEGFAGVIKAVKRHAANGDLEAFPAERVSVVRELSHFDLSKALSKIGSLLESPDSKLLIERVMGIEKTRQIQTTVALALEPETAEKSA